MSLTEPGVTGRKSTKTRQKKHRPTQARAPPSERGTHAYSIPQAGRMVGLSRGASYAAAARGEIPTEWFGDRGVVPKAPWHRKLGIEG
jgi:hypothetical protein